MHHDLAPARFCRALRQPPTVVLDIDDLAALAASAGVTLLQASLLLDADPGWQRVFLDADGLVVAPRAGGEGCSPGEPPRVSWRRLNPRGRPRAA
jgi:hypothetical protein